MEYDEQLMQYGIYAKNYEKNIDEKNINEKNIDEKNIDITGFHIEIIKFNILQKKGVEKLHIKKSSIKKIIFLKENDIDMCFDECLITDPIDAKGLSFKNSLSFITCTFNQKVDFSNSIFNATCIEKNVAFKKSTFKSYVLFNEVCFKTHVDFSETTFEKGVVFNQASFLIEETETNYIEVNFIGTIFKDKARFPNITFEAIVDFSYAVFENEVYFWNTTFASVVHFDEVKFKNTCDFSTAKFLVIQKKEEPERILFEDITFEGVVNFNDVEFESCIFIRNSVFKNKVDFNNAKFSASPYANNFYNVVFESDIWFSDTIFETVALFEKCKYKGKAYMQNTISKQKITFCESRFLDNAYFNNSTFKDFVNFFQCEFEKTACFYGVTFDKTPNFSQVMFKGNLNIVNANLKFDFNDLKSKIKQEYEDCNQDSEKSQKSLEHFANDFRDSFRIFKNALIKDNNLLDASEFHRFELYCKELELKESRHKRGINANNNEDARKNIKPFKEIIDFLLLRFYRNLCDHHTDFLKCFNNLVLLVALYAVLLWIGNFDLMQGKEPIISDILHQLGDKAITLKNDIKKYDWLVFLIFLALAVSCLYYLYKTIYLEHKLYIKNIKLILSFTKNSLKNICFFMLISVAIIFFYAAIIATLITLLNLNDMHYWQSYLNFISFVLFFVIYFSLISLDCVFVRFLLVIAAYIITSISIGKNIAILNPLIGKLLNTSIEIKDPIFQSITIAYTISTLLVLFSLQKTARKNSIVPS